MVAAVLPAVLPCAAVCTAIGTEIRSVSASEPSVRVSVLTPTRASSGSTGRPVRIELPKLPCSILPNHAAYWPYQVRGTPSASRMPRASSERGDRELAHEHAADGLDRGEFHRERPVAPVSSFPRPLAPAKAGGESSGVNVTGSPPPIESFEGRLARG